MPWFPGKFLRYSAAGKAMMVLINGTEAWVPLSTTGRKPKDARPGNECEFYISNRMAQEKGFIETKLEAFTKAPFDIDNLPPQLTSNAKLHEAMWLIKLYADNAVNKRRVPNEMDLIWLHNIATQALDPDINP